MALEHNIIGISMHQHIEVACQTVRQGIGHCSRIGFMTRAKYLQGTIVVHTTKMQISAWIQGRVRGQVVIIAPRAIGCSSHAVVGDLIAECEAMTGLCTGGYSHVGDLQIRRRQGHIRRSGLYRLVATHLLVVVFKHMFKHVVVRVCDHDEVVLPLNPHWDCHVPAARVALARVQRAAVPHRGHQDRAASAECRFSGHIHTVIPARL